MVLDVPATVLVRQQGRGDSVAAVMIGVDPHKASHTAVAISAAEEPLGELRVRACVAQAGRLLGWAAAWPQRTWTVEGAGGTGHLLAQQLLSAGEGVLDVQPSPLAVSLAVLNTRLSPSMMNQTGVTSGARWRPGRPACRSACPARGSP
jgi:hypothetical protein